MQYLILYFNIYIFSKKTILYIYNLNCFYSFDLIKCLASFDMLCIIILVLNLNWISFFNNQIKEPARVPEGAGEAGRLAEACRGDAQPLPEGRGREHAPDPREAHGLPWGGRGDGGPLQR